MPQYSSFAQLRPARDVRRGARRRALQYVRKVAGTTRPSRANEAAFSRAVEEVAGATRRLLDTLVTSAPPRNREAEAAKAKARAAQRFGSPAAQHA